MRGETVDGLGEVGVRLAQTLTVVGDHQIPSAMDREWGGDGQYISRRLTTRRHNMISDILFTAVTQIREELSRNDHVLREWRARGVSVTQDAALRQTIYDVVDQMERLARRLLTEPVGPVTEAQQ
jgi:hypothetical protein